MSILVTGGVGVIGSNVVRELISQGEEVVVADLREDRSLLGEISVPVECGDICDRDFLTDVVRRWRVEKIMHLAAVMPDWAQANPYEAARINTWGLISILEAATRAGISRVVFTSSKAAVGTLPHPYIHPDYQPVSENAATNPYDVYGSAKLAAEVLGKQLAEEFGVDLIVLRLASTYGPGKTARHGKVGILSAIIEGAYRGESVKIPSGADQKNDFLYCKDIAQAVAKAGNSKLGGYHMFHVGSGRLASLRDFVAALQHQLPGADITIGDGLDYAGGGSSHYFLMDIRAARTMLDYQPFYDVERGVADYVSTLRLQSRN